MVVDVSVRVPVERPAAGRAGLVAAAAAALLALLSLAVLLHAGPLAAVDLAVSEAARHLALARPAWRSVMAAVTVTGSTAVLVPVGTAGFLALLATGRRRQAAFVAVALPLTVALRLLLVTAIARPRPVDRLAASSGWSFPSGHTTASAATALVAVLVLAPMLRRRWCRVLLAGLAGGWAVAVGVSRVALVVHWPSDVLGAWLLVLTTVPAVAVLMNVVAPRPGGAAGERDTQPAPAGPPPVADGDTPPVRSRPEPEPPAATPGRAG
jgi:undecaprenyl-diphosphatase